MVRSLVALVQALGDLVHVLVDLVQAHPAQGGLISIISRQVVVGLWVDSICLVSFCERGEEETGLLFTDCAWIGGRVGCIQAKGGS